MKHNNKFNVGNYQLTITVYTCIKSALIEIESKPMLNPISGENETKYFGSISLNKLKSMDDVNFEIFKNIFHWFGRTITRQQVKKIDDFLNSIKED